MTRPRTQWQTPQPRGLHERRHAEATAQATQLVELARETDLPITTVTAATAAGDDRRLRGIPVVGAKGVGGAINGTRPGATLE